MSRIWMINQYASSPSTGVGGRHHHLARQLAAMGHDVTLVAAKWHHTLRDHVDHYASPAEEMVDGYRGEGICDRKIRRHVLLQR